MAAWFTRTRTYTTHIPHTQYTQYTHHVDIHTVHIHTHNTHTYTQYIPHTPHTIHTHIHIHTHTTHTHQYIVGLYKLFSPLSITDSKRNQVLNVNPVCVGHLVRGGRVSAYNNTQIQAGRQAGWSGRQGDEAGTSRVVRKRSSVTITQYQHIYLLHQGLQRRKRTHLLHRWLKEYSELPLTTWHDWPKNKIYIRAN